MLELLNNYKSLIIYAIFLIVAVIFSIVINGLFLRFFKTLGIRNQPDGTVIRWGSLSKPSVGGITFYIIFLLSMACYSILFEPAQRLYHFGFVGLLLTCAAGFLIGLADDAYDTRPLLKFGVQLLCGVILIASGVYINLTHNLLIDYVLTIFWVVGIMNSINMLDNMDGITTIVAIGIVLNTIYVIMFHHDFNNMHLLALMGVLASLLAFLYYNWHPSSMFMGDTGSQFLGAFLATMGIIYFWNDPYALGNPAQGKLISNAVMTFILPILDTTVVVVNRMAKKKSPFIGGKDHTTHCLAYLGLNDRQVAWVFISLSLCSLSLNIMIHRFLYEWKHLYTWAFAGYFAVLLIFFFYTTRHKIIRSKEHTHGQNKLPVSG